MRRREALCAAVQTALRAKGRPFMNYERARPDRGDKDARGPFRIRRCAGNAASGALRLFQVAYFV